MTRVKGNVKPKSKAILEAEAHLQEVRKKERDAVRLDRANAILQEMEGDYSHAKKVFFAVNGARRVLKNA